MIEYLIVGLVLVLISLFFLRSKWEPPQTKPSDDKDWQNYRAVESLFVNRSELALFHALNRTLPNGFYLHSKVRLEDIVRVRTDLKDKRRSWSLRGRIKSRHADF